MVTGDGEDLSSLVESKDEIVVTDDTLNSSVMTKNSESTPPSENNDTVLPGKS